MLIAYIWIIESGVDWRMRC